MSRFSTCFILFSFLVLSVFMVSCASAPKKIKTTNSPAFESTGSFCLDSYLLRSAAVGCENWQITPISDLLEVRCSKKSHTENNDWTDSTFIWFQKSPSFPPIPRFHPICVDENSVFGIISTENVK